MYKIKCEICGEIFEHNFKGSEKKLLSNHLKMKHDVDVKDYVLKYYYNNIQPKCLCGCGRDTDYFKWKFFKYYRDHKNHMKVSKNVLEKRKKTIKENSKYGYIKLGLKYSDLVDMFYEFKNKISLMELSEKYKIDRRTLEKYWILNGISNLKEIRRYKKLHQFVWGNQLEKNGIFVEIDDDLLKEMMDYSWKKHKIRKNLSITQLIKKFNLNYSKYVVEKRLVEKFGDDILKIFKSGLSSEPELEFKYILEFYLGKKNVTHTFPLCGKFYDFLLYDRLLLEFDGEYWHKDKQDNDLLKDNIAKDNNYNIFRVSDKDYKNPLVIIKLINFIKKNKLNEFKKV